MAIGGGGAAEAAGGAGGGLGAVVDDADGVRRRAGVDVAAQFCSGKLRMRLGKPPLKPEMEKPRTVLERLLRMSRRPSSMTSAAGGAVDVADADKDPLGELAGRDGAAGEVIEGKLVEIVAAGGDGDSGGESGDQCKQKAARPRRNQGRLGGMVRRDCDLST